MSLYLRSQNEFEYVEKEFMPHTSTPGISFGKEAKIIEDKIEDVNNHFTYPYTLRTKLHKFCSLAVTWKDEVITFSSVEDIVLNPNYQEIIGMGDDVLPFILTELERELDHWFWALRAISGENPVKEKDRGDVNAMKNEWIEWGKDKGYVI